MMSPDEHFCPDCFGYCDCADIVCSHCDDNDERDFDWNDDTYDANDGTEG